MYLKTEGQKNAVDAFPTPTPVWNHVTFSDFHKHLCLWYNSNFQLHANVMSHVTFPLIAKKTTEMSPFWSDYGDIWSHIQGVLFCSCCFVPPEDTWCTVNKYNINFGNFASSISINRVKTQVKLQKVPLMESSDQTIWFLWQNFHFLSCCCFVFVKKNKSLIVEIVAHKLILPHQKKTATDAAGGCQRCSAQRFLSSVLWRRWKCWLRFKATVLSLSLLWCGLIIN